MSEISIKLLSGVKTEAIGDVEMIERNDAIRIVRLHEQGYSIRQITREMSLSRNTVRKYLRSGGLIGYHGTNIRKGLLSGEEEWLYISDGEPHLHGEIASPSRGRSPTVTD